MADKREDPIRYSRISPDAPGNSTALPHDYVSGNEDTNSSRVKRLIDYMAHDREGNSLAYAQIAQTDGWTHTLTDHYDVDTSKSAPIADLGRTDVKPKDTVIKGYDYNSRTGYPAQENQQLIMFGVDHRPTRRQVKSLYARDSTAGKIATMNMLGIADNASRDALGHGLIPDDNLSEHSLGLVTKLHKKGAIPGEDMPFKSTPSNGIDFPYAAQVLNTQHTSKFDTGELINLNHRLPHAKARIRQALGRSAPTINTEPKNEQLQLEGFE